MSEESTQPTHTPNGTPLSANEPEVANLLDVVNQHASDTIECGPTFDVNSGTIESSGTVEANNTAATIAPHATVAASPNETSTDNKVINDNTKTTNVCVEVDRPTIAISNQSSVVTGAELKSWVAAIQIQIDRDFAPVWYTSAKLVVEADATKAAKSDYAVMIMDNSDVEGALGYHELSAAGVPVAKIFAKDDQTYGLSTSVTLSHELLEMLADASASCCVFNQTSDTAGELVSYECCDAVEDDSCGYKIDDVLVSDFVYPTWFDGFRAANSTKFDKEGHVNTPFSLAAGGYYSYFSIPNTDGWQQKVPNSGIGARLKSKSPAYRSRNFSYPLIENPHKPEKLEK